MASIVASAPGRCGLLGNPSDMYGGSVLSCSLSERATCTIYDSDALILEAGGSDQRQAIHTVADLEPHPNYPLLDLSKAVLKGMGVGPETGLTGHVVTDTEIPMQAGLAGSTALFAAVYGAVAKKIGRQEPPHFVAENIRRIEYEVLGVICGFQDQHMAVFGGLNYMDFRGKGSHLPIDAQPLATIEPLLGSIPAELPFVLAHTGVKHHSGQAHRPVRQRWLENDPEVREAYDVMVPNLAREGKRALLEADWEKFAALMNANQEVQRRLGASGKAVDDLVEVALASGAIGAKLAGAGQGGTVLCLTFTPERTVQALQAAGAGRILVPRPSVGLQTK
jgi:galactokinase/mevalonate kinase-like predicted kinase